MDDLLMCSVCIERYHEVKRHPVLLPRCGHSFCRPCVSMLISGGGIVCPTCRTDQRLDHVEKLPTEFTLLAIINAQENCKKETCELHNVKLSFWCRTCKTSTCGECLFEDHPTSTHDVIKASKYISDIKKNAQEVAIRFIEALDEREHKYYKTIFTCARRISNAIRNVKVLRKDMEEARDLMKGVKEGASISAATSLAEAAKFLGLKWNIQDTNLFYKEKETKSTVLGMKSFKNEQEAAHVNGTNGELLKNDKMKPSFDNLPLQTIQEENDISAGPIEQGPSKLNSTEDNMTNNTNQLQNKNSNNLNGCNNSNETLSSPQNCNTTNSDVTDKKWNETIQKDNSINEDTKTPDVQHVSKQNGTLKKENNLQNTPPKEKNLQNIPPKDDKTQTAPTQETNTNNDDSKEARQKFQQSNQQHQSAPSRSKPHKQKSASKKVISIANELSLEIDYPPAPLKGIVQDLTEDCNQNGEFRNTENLKLALEYENNKVRLQNTQKREAENSEVSLQSNLINNLAEEEEFNGKNESENHENKSGKEAETSKGVQLVSTSSHKEKYVHSTSNHTEEKLMDFIQVPGFMICVEASDGKLGVIEWGPHGLHVYCLQFIELNYDIVVRDSFLNAMIPSKAPMVFLELSTDQTVIGRVYIKLWGHLKRAHNFLSLCLGDQGASYVNSKFLQVYNIGEDGERILGGDYESNNGRGGKELISELEWNGDYTMEMKSGMITAAGTGQPATNSLFLICTQSDPTRSFSCPFGSVFDGLKVVEEAVKLSHSSEVWINNCGVLIAPPRNDVLKIM